MTSPAIAATVPLSRSIAPAAAANKAGYARRLIGQGSSLLSRASTWVKSLPGVSKVVSVIGAGIGRTTRFLRAAAARSDVRWLVANAAVTPEGQKVLGAVVVRPASWLVRTAFGLLYSIVRTPARWVRAERFVDVPFLFIARTASKVRDWAAPKVTKALDPDNRLMLTLQVVSAIGLALAMRDFNLLGAASRIVRVVSYLGAIFTLFESGYALAKSVPAVRESISRVTYNLTEMVAGVEHTVDELPFAQAEVKVAQEALDANPDSEKARKDLLRAQKIEADLLKKKAEQAEIDEQLRLLDTLNVTCGQHPAGCGLGYALAIRQKDPRVKVFTEVMSRNQAMRVLREHGEPTAYQTAGKPDTPPAAATA